MTGRNLILVIFDSARADAFGSDTPTFEELGSRGMRFERAIAPAGWTLPSHTSMFTGLMPTEHKIVGSPGGAERVLANSRTRVSALQDKLLAPRLAAAGIRTFLSSASPWLTKASGLDRGFQDTDHFNFLQLPPHPSRVRLPKRARQTLNTLYSIGDHARWARSGRDKGAARVLEGMERFIADDPAPFFACTTLMDTHEPHLPPEKSDRSFLATANIVLQPGLMRLVRMHAHTWGTRVLSPRVISQWRAAYEREIAYVDSWLARLMEMLDRSGRADETVVVVTADHGETFGEGGTVGHGVSLREGLARVPLVIAGAGVDANRIEGPVSLARIAPTVTDLLLAPTEGSLIEGSDGIASMEIEHPAHVAHPTPRAKRTARGPGAAFYDGSLKVVVDPWDLPDAPPRLYDLVADPEETNDLSSTREATERQGKLLESWRERAAYLPT